MGMFKALFGTYSEREVKRIKPLVDKIESLDSAMGELSEEQLKAKTGEFRERYKNGESLDDLLPEAFAVVREASWRVLKMKHYREQLIGGIVLHQGRIAEMKTGEGKTLVATLPAYLNAISGEGVHVITVNDYLASRDREWMGQIYEYLGLTTGVVVHDLNNDQRREAYNADITYGTNNEFGFDYLRDNMVIYKEERVQRGLNFVIGPMIMMKFMCMLTKELGIKTTVSLNPIMVDGTGMCGACRVTVGDEVKFACVDGPEFDGHLVNFDEAMRRQTMYKTEEGRAILKEREGDTHHGGCGHCGGDK